jgi:hypothetical protein
LKSNGKLFLDTGVSIFSNMLSILYKIPKIVIMYGYKNKIPFYMDLIKEEIEKIISRYGYTSYILNGEMIILTNGTNNYTPDNKLNYFMNDTNNYNNDDINDINNDTILGLKKLMKKN